MNTEITDFWDTSSPSLRPDEVLSLLRLGLETDDNDDVAMDQEEATPAQVPVIPGGSKRLRTLDKAARSHPAPFE